MSRKNPWDNKKSREAIMRGIRLAARKRRLLREATPVFEELARQLGAIATNPLFDALGVEFVIVPLTDECQK